MRKVFGILFIIQLLLSLIYSEKTFSQNKILEKKVSIILHKQCIESVLDSISKKANCFFTYNSKLLDYNKKHTINYINTPLIDILYDILDEEKYSFQEIKKQIIITKGNKKLVEFYPDKNVLSLNGYVFDSKTKEKLAFASVSLKGKYIGTTSNADGKYIFKINKKYYKDTIVFSFLAYSNYYLAVKDIIKLENNISLSPKSISLQEIFIRNTNPRSLIESALKLKEKNYFHKEAILESFYRESVTKNSKYMIYLESFMNIYKSSNKYRYKHQIVEVKQARKIYDVRRIDTTSIRLKGGVGACLDLDIINNNISFLEPQMFKYYNYSLIDITILNNRTVYLISASAKQLDNTEMISAYIYIDAVDLAFVKFELFYPKKALKNFKNKMILKKSGKLKIRTLDVRYNMTYRCVNKKYYLSKSAGLLSFRIKNKHKLFANIFKVNFEMLVTNVDTLNTQARINKNKRLKINSFMSKKKYKYDPDFWGDKIIIEPERNILNAIKKVKSFVKEKQ